MLLRHAMLYFCVAQRVGAAVKQAYSQADESAPPRCMLEAPHAKPVSSAPSIPILGVQREGRPEPKEAKPAAA